MVWIQFGFERRLSAMPDCLYRRRKFFGSKEWKCIGWKMGIWTLSSFICWQLQEKGLRRWWSFITSRAQLLLARRSFAKLPRIILMLCLLLILVITHRCLILFSIVLLSRIICFLRSPLLRRRLSKHYFKCTVINSLNPMCNTLNFIYNKSCN